MVVFSTSSGELEMNSHFIVGDTVHTNVQGLSPKQMILALLGFYYIFQLDYPKGYAMVLATLQVLVLEEPYKKKCTRKQLQFVKDTRDKMANMD